LRFKFFWMEQLKTDLVWLKQMASQIISEMQRRVNKWVWAETSWTPDSQKHNPTDWAHPFWLAPCFQVIFSRYLLILGGVKHSCSLDRSVLALCHSIRPEACTCCEQIVKIYYTIGLFVFPLNACIVCFGLFCVKTAMQSFECRLYVQHDVINPR